MTRFHAVVTIETDTLDHAREVLTERISYDEDYGFDYLIDFQSDEITEQ